MLNYSSIITPCSQFTVPTEEKNIKNIQCILEVYLFFHLNLSCDIFRRIKWNFLKMRGLAYYSYNLVYSVLSYIRFTISVMYIALGYMYNLYIKNPNN